MLIYNPVMDTIGLHIQAHHHFVDSMKVYPELPGHLFSEGDQALKTHVPTEGPAAENFEDEVVPEKELLIIMYVNKINIVFFTRVYISSVNLDGSR